MSNNFIDDLFDNLRRDPFKTDPTNQTSYELQKDFLDDPQGPEGWVADGVIGDSQLIDGSTLVGKVDTLPTLPADDYPEGKVVYLTTNGKLYRNDSDVWTAAVATVDLTGQITGTQITDDSITSPKIAANAVVADKIAANAITTDKLNANAVTAAKIAAGTITATEIASATITADKMVVGTITAASAIIADAAITGAKIANATITDANISSLNADKLTAGSITIAPSSGVSAISSTNFNVTSAGSVSAKDLTIGTTTTTTNGTGNEVSGFIYARPGDNVTSSQFRLVADDSNNLTKSITGITSSGAAANVNCTINATAHPFSQGQFVWFTGATGAGAAVLNAITEALPAQVISTTTNAFVINYYLAIGAITAGTVTGGKRLSVVAPSGLFVYQNDSAAGFIATGSLALGSSLTKLGKGSTATLADGEIGFLSATTPRYGSGANLYSSNGTSNLSTSGSFTVGGTLTASTISATNYGLVAGDIPTLTLGTDTAGNYVSSVTSGNSLISVSGSGAEGAAVTITADTSPTFTGLITGSGGAELSGSIDLNSTVSATSLSATSNITNSRDVRIFFGTGGGLAQWRVFQDSSSLRYKTNIVDLPDSDAILDVVPITYHDKLDYEERGEESARQYGFLAEDMAENIDGQSYVVYNEDGTPEAIQYSRLAVPLHSAMRKLRSKIDDLEARLAALEGDVA